MVKKRKRRYWLIAVIILLIIGGSIFAYNHIMDRNTQQLWTLSFDEMVEITTQNNEEAIITVGYIQGGESFWDVYSHQAEEPTQNLYDYEIGSITKTLTAALTAKAVEEGKLSLSDTINTYLPLDDSENTFYPTIEEVLTHTAGYRTYYFEWDSMIRNFILRQNLLGNVSEEQFLQRISNVSLDPEDTGGFYYSNVGPSIMGAILEVVYDEEYTPLMEKYMTEDLGFINTWISHGEEGNLDNYWQWDEDAAYIPAGAIVSNAEDMLTYLELNMNDAQSELSLTHQQLYELDSPDLQLEDLGLYIDGVGMAWILDEHTNIIWHNGITLNFNSYFGFDKEAQVGVVILSNLPAAQWMQVPATVMGPALLNDLRND